MATKKYDPRTGRTITVNSASGAEQSPPSSPCAENARKTAKVKAPVAEVIPVAADVEIETTVSEV